MPRFASYVQGWWTLLGKPAQSSVHFEITCACGHATVGTRGAKHQVLACAACGRKMFVLPLSRLPPVLTDAERARQDTWLRRLRERVLSLGPGQQALLASGCTLMVVALILFAALRGLIPAHSPELEEPGAVARHMQSGQRALSQGKFHVARRELSVAVSLSEHYPGALGHAERRKLAQLHRQAALLADLLLEPLDEVLRRAAELSELDEHEWQEAFRARYQGRAILFWNEVKRDGGRCRLLGQIPAVRGQPAKVELSDVHLLQQLPLETPQRLLFGARLASIVRDRWGVWEVGWQPDSGVLLTDQGAAAACSTLQPAELRSVIERQAAWLAELP